MEENTITNQSNSVDLLARLPSPPEGKIGWPWTEAIQPSLVSISYGNTWPRITVITPSYNQATYLEETIRSVLLQGYPNLEYMVIDGGSQDESVAIIERYSEWLNYWVSESDKGQAHAISKGLQRATGELFNWINSDDLLTPGALPAIAMAFMETKADVVAASCIDFREDIERTVTNSNLSLEKLLVWKPGTVYHQPAVWLRRALLLNCGGINEQYHFVFDWEMMLRYLLQYPNVKYIQQIVARFRLHSSSKTVAQAQAFESERLELWEVLKYTLPRHRLRQLCSRKLRHVKWLSLLNSMEKNPKGPSVIRAIKLMGLAFCDPTIRFTRMTAGAIKRHLLNQYRQLTV